MNRSETERVTCENRTAILGYVLDRAGVTRYNIWGMRSAFQAWCHQKQNTVGERADIP